MIDEMWKEYIDSHFSNFPYKIGKLSKTSAAVIKSHQAKFQFQGAIIASLSIPGEIIRETMILVGTYLSIRK